MPFCLAAPLREEKKGLIALVRRGAGQDASTVRRPPQGSIGVRVAVVGRVITHRWFTFLRMLSFLRYAIETV